MAGTGHRESLRRIALHLVTLSSFALSQPLLEVLTRNPEFFVAHRLTPGDLVLLPVLLAVVPAAVLLCGVLVARRFGEAAARMAVACAVSVFVCFIALQATRRLGAWPSAAAVGFAVTVAAGAGALYVRVATARTFVTWLWPGLLVFPTVFFFNASVRPFLVPIDRTTGVETSVEGDTPVVMVVFDQLPVTSLLDARHQVDAVRFPAFAALAADSTWFRQATSSADLTGWSLPTILTGNFPDAGRSPTAQQYPHNLFALLGSSYAYEVVEPITKLCPERLCGSDREPFVPRLAGTLTDLAVVYLHIVLPRDLEERLPSLTENWRDFVASQSWQNRWVTARDRDRRASAMAFIQSIDGRHPGRTLYFLHVLLPHEPYIYLPSGQELASDRQMVGLRRDGRWTQNEWFVSQAYRRHLLQAGYVDGLLARLVARLKDVGLYDRSLLVVTSDHGVAFGPSEPFKAVSARSAPEILRVPLFIKAPGQREGLVSDRNVESIDIVPTMTDLLGTAPTWTPDGVSALRIDAPERPVKIAYCDGARRKFTMPADELQTRLQAVVDRKIRWFGSGNLDWQPRLMPHAELVGRRVAEQRVDQVVPDITVTVNSAWRLDDIDPTAPVLPLPFSGRLTSSRPLGDMALAIGINGTIRATTWASASLDPRSRDWSALVLPDSFRAGTNVVEVFAIDGTEPVTLRQLFRSTVRTEGLNLASESARDVWNVEQTGLYGRELLRPGRWFRWTDGQARFTTSINPQRPPRSLRIGLGDVASRGPTLTLRLGTCVLFEGPVPASRWYRTFSLDGCPLSGDRVTIELSSDTFVPGGDDRRELGVALESINLFRAAWPLPSSSLPADGRRFRVAFPAGTPSAMTDAAAYVLVEVTNRGELPWPSASDLGGPTGAVRLGVRWFRVGRPSPIAEVVRDLPHALYPGDTADVPVPVVPPGGPDLAPGTYELQPGVMQEGAGWFADGESPRLRITVGSPR